MFRLPISIYHFAALQPLDIWVSKIPWKLHVGAWRKSKRNLNNKRKKMGNQQWFHLEVVYRICLDVKANFTCLMWPLYLFFPNRDSRYIFQHSSKNMTTPEQKKPVGIIFLFSEDFFQHLQTFARQDGLTLAVIVTSQAPHAPHGWPLSQTVQQWNLI